MSGRDKRPGDMDARLTSGEPVAEDEQSGRSYLEEVRRLVAAKQEQDAQQAEREAKAEKIRRIKESVREGKTPEELADMDRLIRESEERAGEDDPQEAEDPSEMLAALRADLERRNAPREMTEAEREAERIRRIKESVREGKTPEELADMDRLIRKNEERAEEDDPQEAEYLSGLLAALRANLERRNAPREMTEAEREAERIRWMKEQVRDMFLEPVVNPWVEYRGGKPWPGEAGGAEEPAEAWADTAATETEPQEERGAQGPDAASARPADGGSPAAGAPAAAAVDGIRGGRGVQLWVPPEYRGWVPEKPSGSGAQRRGAGKSRAVSHSPVQEPEAGPPWGSPHSADSGVSAIDHVFQEVVSAVIDGKLQPGERLPPEAELSRRLGVGRNSMREAVKALAAYGVVAIRRPSGTYICDSYSPKMLSPMLYGLLLRENSWSELVRLRSVLDMGVMHLAVRGVTRGDLLELEAILRRLEEVLHNPPDGTERFVDAVMELDQQFHQRIVDITGSRMTRDVTEYITRFTIPSRKRTVEGMLRRGEAGAFLRKHEEILRVLRDRATDEIERVILGHYEYWESGDI